MFSAFAQRVTASLKSGNGTAALSLSQGKTELLAGLTVALALVPEAVAFAFVAGVTPLSGLYAAFIVCLITATFGGRPGMISGATGALAVVAVGLVHDPRVGDQGPQYLFAAVVLMGILQLFAGVFRLGKFMRLVPHPVMLGFVNGLAIVIFLAQLGQFQVPGSAEASGHGFANGEWLSGAPLAIMLALTVLTMAIIWLMPKFTKAVPAPLAAIGIVAAIVVGFGLDVPSVGDLASVKGGLPEFSVPMVPLNLETLRIIFPYAFILASVGLIESLLTLNLVGEITGKRGGASQECLAQGGANVVTGFFGGMGGCAMIGQSMINVKAGGRTRLSGIAAALLLLFFIVAGSSLIEMIPLAALAGVMFMVVIGTFAWQSLRIMTRIPKMDAFVIILVTGVTVISDLATAVLVGVVVSALSYAWNNAKRIRVIERDSVREPGAHVYEIEGPLFFGSTDGFAQLFHPETDPDVVIVDFMRSRVVDQSALQAIEDLAARYEAHGKTLRLRHLSRDCHKRLKRAGQLVVQQDDDPDYGLAVDYDVRTGIFAGAH
ncbi:SulP family inorganic anion transporter [Hyphomonas sp.]|uniref:SulP family inorganic anion transporter n=1 Tax=Hyphomonas sp. TaxID=87 RepID=UPI00391C7253